MPRYALVLEYSGASFAGYQVQSGDTATVQGRLTEAASTILRRPLKIEGAARTDAGVHAGAQVAAFTTEDAIGDLGRFQWSLNAILRPDVVVRQIVEVPSDFDPRRSAVAREYFYLVLNRPYPSVFLKDFSYWYGAALDAQAMSAAAARLVGTHDFTSFCTSEAATLGSTVRNVESLEVNTMSLPGGPPPGAEAGGSPGEETVGRLIVIHVRANAFLHNMMRIIAGTLLEVGLGKRTEESVTDVLEARMRPLAGPTLPASGLILAAIHYPLEATGGAKLLSSRSDAATLLRPFFS